MLEFVRYAKKNTLAMAVLILGLIVFRNVFPVAYNESRFSPLTDLVIILGLPISIIWDLVGYLVKKKDEEE